MIFLDILFTFLHIVIIGFNLIGWIWRRTRRLHLIIVALTIFSWLLLGIWYGWGYCFLTDWHWEVKARLGERGLPNSFIKYALDEMFNRSFRTGVVDTVTLVTFIAIIIITIYVNFMRRASKKLNSK